MENQIKISDIIKKSILLVDKNPNTFDDYDFIQIAEIVDWLSRAKILLIQIIDTPKSNLSMDEKRKLYDDRDMVVKNKSDSIHVVLTKNYLNDCKKILEIMYELEMSKTYRPLNGLVINRDRIKFQNILFEIKKRYSE